MDFNNLNKVAQANDFPLTRKMATLSIGEVYSVDSINRVKTKFGKAIVVKLNNEFTIFLPRRMADILTDDKIIELREIIEAYGLNFRYTGGKYNSFEFIKKNCDLLDSGILPEHEESS